MITVINVIDVKWLHVTRPHDGRVEDVWFENQNCDMK